MFQNVNAEIIAIGTEILLGEITDTNSVYLARALRDLGINLYFKTAVGDNEGRIASAIRLALSRADVVITCGGLGPTVDDMTRQGIAAATGRELVFHQELLDQIAARFTMFRAQMTENNRRQAYLPQGATVIENPVGTAPAFIVPLEGRCIISLPGVPREMKFLMTERVIPYLRQTYHLGIIKARNVKVAGIGESALDDMLGADLLEASNPSLGLAAHQGVVDIRLTAKAADAAAADALLDAFEAQVRERVGEYIFGRDSDTLEGVLTQLLQAQGQQVAVIEAGIQDAVIAKIQAAAGSAAVLAATHTYPDPASLYAAITDADGLSFRELAGREAERLCQASGAAGAIVIISLPEAGDDADTAEATAVAVYTPARSQSRVYGFGGKEDLARGWVSRWAMSVLWRMLKEQQHDVD
ncbi:MAG: CinA family nicotinamide mononucleotide deamidase-related protein [Anaerolineae bacterium]|nr:CinA family nicotinamide mononucleotide deamidase-related protein [Anaerolineae bacterium]